MMDRRGFIGALGGGLLATPLLYAQRAERVYHIGWYRRWADKC